LYDKNIIVVNPQGFSVNRGNLFGSDLVMYFLITKRNPIYIILANHIKIGTIFAPDALLAKVWI